MPIQTSKAVDVLTGLEQQMGQTVDVLRNGQPQRADGTPIVDPAELHEYYQKLESMGIDVRNLGVAIENSGEQKDNSNQVLQDSLPPEVDIKASSYFSLKTSQLSMLQSPGNDMPRNDFADPNSAQGGGSKGGMGENDPFEGFSIENVEFPNFLAVKDALTAIGNPEEAVEQFFNRFGKNNGFTQDPNVPGRVSGDDDAMRDPINEFFSTNDDSVKDKIAEFLFDTIISNSAKSSDKTEENNVPDPNQPTQTPAQQVSPAIAQIVENSNSFIKKLAEKHQSEAKPKSFNLQKEAQHKALQNVMMYGPSNKIDQFTNQPISDWHLVERNKGFGLQFGGIWNMDWESLWRQNVMDKYSPPHRDKDGNWVGGYIEDRFEVDKNIPSYNNMQLKPGEKRRPTPPEFRQTEARLEALRDGGKPFNWAKEASAKKKVSEIKVADGAKNDNFLPELPSLDSMPVKQPQRWCSICGAKMKNVVGVGGKGGNPNECPGCHAIVPTPLTTDPQLNRSQKGLQEGPQSNPYIQQGVNLQTSGGVFFNGDKFVCYSQNKKVLFNTFNEAEQFQKANVAPVIPNTAPVAPKRKPVINVDDECEQPVVNMTPEQLKKHQSMHSLAIDG